MIQASKTIKTVDTNERLEAFDWLYQLTIKKHEHLISRSIDPMNVKARQAIELYLGYLVAMELRRMYPKYLNTVKGQLDQSIEKIIKECPSNDLFYKIFNGRLSTEYDPIFNLREELKKAVKKDFEFIREELLSPEIEEVSHSISKKSYFYRSMMVVAIGLGLYLGLGVILPLIGLVLTKEVIGVMIASSAAFLGIYLLGQSVPGMYRSTMCRFWYGSWLGDKERQYIDKLNPNKIEKNFHLNKLFSSTTISTPLKETWIDLLQWMQVKKDFIADPPKVVKSIFSRSESKVSTFSLFGKNNELERVRRDSDETSQSSFESIDLGSDDGNYGRYGGRV